MLVYTIKRLLMMIPVFFLISLVVFVLLNLAPGRPGESGGDQAQTAKVANQSALLFKQQFHFDKPILFNTRYNLGKAEVQELLVTAFAIQREPPAAQRIAAREALEDGGAYLLSGLIALSSGEDPVLCWRAQQLLVLAALEPLVAESAGDVEEIARKNREIDAQNQVFRDWSCEKQEEECLATQRARWEGWWEEHRERYTYEGWEKVSVFFLDTRFAYYWRNLLRLDFGTSVVNHEPVLPQLLGRLKYSISLSLMSVVLAYILALPIGIYSAVRPGSRLDTVLTLKLFLLYSLPSFFTATVLLKLLSQGTPVAWFPTGGFYSANEPPVTTLGQMWDIAWHLALPIATSTSVALAGLSRYARTGVIDVIRADYIRTARAKGLSEPVVILKHAVRNGMIPILTLLGGLLPVLVSGGVVIETVFNIPGMGQFLVDAINQRDYNVVMAVLLASSWLTQIGILLSDLSYALVDPRISLD